MSKGYRMIDGRQYSLCGRCFWRDEAVAEAARLRKQGHLVRLIKVGFSTDFLIYVHACGDGRGGRQQ